MLCVLHKHQLCLVIQLIPLTEQVFWLQCNGESHAHHSPPLKDTKGPLPALQKTAAITDS